jgi:peptidoglycan/LPS O-acetylase OafA/YrhL
MPKPKAADIKNQLQVIDRDLYHLRRAQWIFSKRMLKMGIASWLLGLFMFLLAAFILVSFQVLQQTFSIWIPLILVALATPIIISAVFVHRIVMKISRLERARKNLMEKYEKAMLKRVEQMVSKR